MTIAVSEVFGPTIQGEGPSTGVPAMFVRLGGCNLSCSWCDTPYTWDAKRYDLRHEITALTPESVALRVNAHAALTDLVVITGGEPLLQAAALAQLIPLLANPVEIETNGTQPPLPIGVFAYNVSPKLPHAGDFTENPAALEAFAAHPAAAFKFVCRDDRDLERVDAFADRYEVQRRRIWIMPEGVTVAAVSSRLAVLAPGVIARGYRLTGRMHVTIWGGARGH